MERRDGFIPVSKGIYTKAKAKLSAGIWTQDVIPNCHVYKPQILQLWWLTEKRWMRFCEKHIPRSTFNWKSYKKKCEKSGVADNISRDKGIHGASPV